MHTCSAGRAARARPPRRACLAKALLCQKGPTAEPDGTCEDCQMIAEGVHPDVYELDAASRTGVENVREEIIGRVQFAPTRGRYKVYIIDEVHMLSMRGVQRAAEDAGGARPTTWCSSWQPPTRRKVPETIHSRCQRFDFRRISTEAIVSRLRRGMRGRRCGIRRRCA